MDIVTHEVEREVTELGELVLLRFTAATGETGYEIHLNGVFLMATHGCHSERLMARLAWQRLSPDRRRGLDVLVGGLGAGHTVRSALDLDGVRRVVVAEIGRRVVAWNRQRLAPFNGAAVDDPRVEIVVDDVYRVLAARPSAFDLILLDVDNGPGWLASPANAGLYRSEGLAAGLRSLRAGGVLAVWSPAPNAALEDVLASTSCSWEAVSTAAEAKREGEPAVIVYLLRGECRPASEQP